MDENPFRPDLYTSGRRSGIARLGAAFVFLLFFIITVPIWLWRRNGVGRVIATAWVVGIVYLGYSGDVYAVASEAAKYSSAIVATHAANIAALAPLPVGQTRQEAASAPVTESALPTVTPAPVLLPTVTPVRARLVTPTPQPLPTVTPWRDDAHWAIVTQGRLNLRAEPSPDADITGKLATGTCVRVLSTSPEWLEVRLPNGDQGWSAREFLELAPSCSQAAVP